MRLAVFGATGGTGQHLVRQALAAGHHVTAVVRDRAYLRHADHPRLEPVVADVMNPESIRPVVTRQDAVVSTLGPRASAVDRSVRGGITIARADLAHAMLAALDDPSTAGHTIAVGY